jgi:hypothetical protein
LVNLLIRNTFRAVNDNSNEFKEWMDERGLKSQDIAADLHVEEQTVRIWRSQGVPPRRQPHVAKYMAEWTDPSQRGAGAAIVSLGDTTADSMERLLKDQIVLTPTPAQYDQWDRASRAANAPTFKDWIVDGLDRLAEKELGHENHGAAETPMAAENADDVSDLPNRPRVDVEYPALRPLPKPPNPPKEQSN